MIGSKIRKLKNDFEEAQSDKIRDLKYLGLRHKNKKPTRLSGFRGTSRDRTRDTWIFSPLLYHLS